ncbi:MAG: TIGR02444 family protein [Dongiaceae bacterium]
MAAGDNGFWEFSVKAFGTEGIAPALIALQDRAGAHVNLLLFCCWAAAEGIAVDAALLRQARESAGAWQSEIVEPLRALRRKLKGGYGEFPSDDVEALRKQINGLEIEGERIEQSRLAALAAARPRATADGRLAVAGLARYFAALGRRPDETDAAHLKSVLTRLFPGSGLDRLSASDFAP